MVRACFSIVSRIPLVPLVIAVLTTIGFIVVLTTIGCFGQYSVSGKVTVDGKPLSSGGILFVPDEVKGNKSTQQPAASIDESGNYKLYTDKKAGAPPGWYKVVVIAKTKLDISKPKEAVSLVDERYSSVDTTELSIEVKSRGNYNLDLKGPQSTRTMPK